MLLANKIKESEESIVNKTLGFRKFLESLRQSRCQPLSILKPSSQSIHESEPLPEHERPNEGNCSEVLHYDRSEEMERSLNNISSGISSKVAEGDRAIKNKLRVGVANRQRANCFRLPSYCFEQTKLELGDHLKEVKKDIPKLVMDASRRGRAQRQEELDSLIELKGLNGEQTTKISGLNPSLVLKYCSIHQLTSSSSLKEILLFFTRLLQLLNFTMSEPKIQRYKNCVYFGQPIRKNQIYQGIVYYYSGIVYFGELYNNQRNGMGVQVDFTNNSIYKGEFKDGDMVGFFEVFRDGEKYFGQLHDGKYHGRGKLIHGDEIFEGEFRQGKKVYGSTHKHSGRKDLSLNKNQRKSPHFWSNQKSLKNSRTQRFEFSNNQVRAVRSNMSSHLQLDQQVKRQNKRYAEQSRDFSFPLNHELQGAFNPQKKDIVHSKQKSRVASMRIREVGKMHSSRPIVQQQMQRPLINKF